MSYKFARYCILMIALNATVFAGTFQETRERIEKKYNQNVQKFDENWRNSNKEYENFQRKFNTEWSSMNQ